MRPRVKRPTSTCVQWIFVPYLSIHFAENHIHLSEIYVCSQNVFISQAQKYAARTSLLVCYRCLNKFPQIDVSTDYNFLHISQSMAH